MQTNRTLLLTCLLIVALMAGGCFGVKVPSLSVSGVITDRDGVPIEGALIRVGDRMAESDADGSFTVHGLKPGTYTISAEVDRGSVRPEQITLDRTPLWIPLVAGENMDKNLIANFDFSKGVYGDGIPVGWVSFARYPDEGADYEVTDEMARTGRFSFKITDHSAERGSGIRSNVIPVTPGEVYRAEIDAYPFEGAPTQIYLDYRAGNERVDTKVVAPDPSIKEWQRMVIEREVPPGADNASIILYTGTSGLGIVYFDHVLLYKVE